MKLEYIEFEDGVYAVGFDGIGSIHVSQDGYVLINRNEAIEIRSFEDAMDWCYA